MSTYQDVLNQALLLKLDEQLQLIQELAANVRQHLQSRPKHRITELKGLGKEVWQKIDVDKFIEEERTSWD